MSYNEAIDNFLLMIQEHYELKYTSDRERKYIQEFLQPQECDLKNLFLKVTVRHSKKWKSLPGIAEFYEVMKDDKNKRIEYDANQAWLSILNISDGDDVLIQDTYIYQIVSAYGSWWRFCEERDNNREWTHKDFLKRYAMVREYKQKVPPKVLWGESRKALGSSAVGIQVREIGQGTAAIGQDKNDDYGLLNFIRRVEE